MPAVKEPVSLMRYDNKRPGGVIFSKTQGHPQGRHLVTRSSSRPTLQIGQHTHLLPYAIETAGTWHEMAIELTREIGRRITTITEDTRETTFLFQRLSMALQRGNAVSFHNTMVTE